MNPRAGEKLSLSLSPVGCGAARCQWSSAHSDGHTARALGEVQREFYRNCAPEGHCPVGFSCHSSADFGRAMALHVHRGSAPELCQAVATVPKSCVFCTDTCVISHE